VEDLVASEDSIASQRIDGSIKRLEQQLFAAHEDQAFMIFDPALRLVLGARQQPRH
jgi:hypothetical protein